MKQSGEGKENNVAEKTVLKECKPRGWWETLLSSKKEMKLREKIETEPGTAKDS